MGLNEPGEVEGVLEKLAEALTETVVRFGSLIELTNQVRDMHASGTTYWGILETADRPLISETLRDSVLSLQDLAHRLRGATAREALEEGVSIERIAEHYGVSRQRISILLQIPANPGRPLR
jgi:hypothetical protein